jgi:hypothetical protein
VLTTTTTGDEPPAAERSAHPAAPSGEAPEPPSAGDRFVSSPRGARLARHLAVRSMADWGHPPSSDASCAVALVVAELAANAVRHGRVPGRDFLLRLVLDAPAGLVRVEVADAAGEERPPSAPLVADPGATSGRGLFLVDALAVHWGSAPRDPVGKIVWADVATGPGGAVGPASEGPTPGGR